jgi:hypothetical protein
MPFSRKFPESTPATGSARQTQMLWKTEICLCNVDGMDVSQVLIQPAEGKVICWAYSRYPLEKARTSTWISAPFSPVNQQPSAIDPDISEREN